MTVGIIGAGPAGTFLGSKLRWDKPIVFEKKENVGCPIQCTGIVTDSIYRVMDSLPESIIKNYVDTFRIRSPDGKTLDIKLDKQNIILDRCGFDRHIAKLCTDAGTEIRTKHEFKGYTVKTDPSKKSSENKKGEYLRVAFGNGKFEDVDYLVGADGPFSPVAKAAGIYGNREILTGWQSRVQVKKKEQQFDPHVTEVLFGLGEFAWIVPESKTVARIGIIGKNTPKQNIKTEFDKLVAPYKHLENQSGWIPMYNPKQVMQQGRVALIGDAATQVKATTYGGIIYGLISGTYIAEGWQGYEDKFRAKLGKDLWISNKMREVMNKLSEKDCNELVQIFEKEENKSILANSDRNFPSQFIVKLLLKETKLWKYGFKLFG